MESGVPRPRAAGAPARLSAAEARRIAVAAAGLAGPRPRGGAGLRRAGALAARLGVIQIDAVNVLARAHEMPLFSRLGAHPPDAVARLAARGALVEAWAHEASLVPAAHHPLLEWRRRRPHPWRSLTRLAAEQPGMVEAVFAEVAAAGRPLTAGELGERTVRRGPWWGWDGPKQALEVLFWQGRLAARRRPDFRREYGLPERLLPPEARVPAPPEPEARRALLDVAARNLGVATAADLADYHRQSPREARPVVEAMAAAGALLRVAVDGWREPAYLHPEARIPRRVGRAALVSPFDPLVWHRGRTERIWGFRYRLEIYTPAPARVHGYYVLPLLLGDRLVARVDLKADRPARTLVVRTAWAEPGAPPRTAGALAAELWDLARWRGLETVRVDDRGDLAPALRAAVDRAPASP